MYVCLGIWLSNFLGCWHRHLLRASQCNMTSHICKHARTEGSVYGKQTAGSRKVQCHSQVFYHDGQLGLQEDMLDAPQVVKGLQQGTADWDDALRPGTVAPPPGFAAAAKASLKAADTASRLHTHQLVCPLFFNNRRLPAPSSQPFANTLQVAV